MINKEEQKRKEFLEYERRSNEISALIRKIPWKKLDEPIQNGWLVNIELSEEAKRRKDAAAMQEAINLCDKGYKLSKERGSLISQLRKDKVMSKTRQHFVRTTWDGYNVYDGPHLSKLEVKEWEKLPEHISKFFEKVTTVTVSRWGGQQHTYTKYVINIPDYNLALKVRKRMLTQIKDIDPKLEAEEKWLDDKLRDWWLTNPHQHSRAAYRGYETVTSQNFRKKAKVAIKKVQNGQISDIYDDPKVGRHKQKL